jgi:AcrR family transcriptional regulator
MAVIVPLPAYPVGTGINSFSVEFLAPAHHDGQMSTTDPPPPAKRRGRRPAGQDTRAALVEAAHQVFSESGYEGATVRAIAARAGVDAAMVNHWFGGKEGLFAQVVLRLPVDPQDLVATLLDGDLDGLGERIVRRFLGVWDSTAGGTFPALVRSLASHDQAAVGLRDFLIRHILARVVTRIRADQPQLRAGLCASQLIGIGMIRYVAKFDPLATADVETVVAAVGPTLQRYLTGEIGAADG